MSLITHDGKIVTVDGKDLTFDALTERLDIANGSESATLAEAVGNTETSKAAIASAITAKGGTVGANDGLEDFPEAIAAILSVPTQIASITTHDYVQSEDWLSDANGNGLNLANVYMPYISGENHIYIIKCTNNTATANYNFSGGVCSRCGGEDTTAGGISYRNSFSNSTAATRNAWKIERSLWISAGANIHVVDIKLEVQA